MKKTIIVPLVSCAALFYTACNSLTSTSSAPHGIDYYTTMLGMDSTHKCTEYSFPIVVAQKASVDSLLKTVYTTESSTLVNNCATTAVLFACLNQPDPAVSGQTYSDYYYQETSSIMAAEDSSSCISNQGTFKRY